MPHFPRARARLRSSYRITSLIQGLAYLALGASIYLRPPMPAGGKPSVFDLVISSAAAGALIGAAAVLLIISAARLPIRVLAYSHGVLMTTTLAYCVAAAEVSAVNGSGFQVAALCGVAAAGHAHYLVTRPLEIGRS